MAHAARDSAFVRWLGARIDDGTLGSHLSRKPLMASVSLNAPTIEAIARRLNDPSAQ